MAPQFLILSLLISCQALTSTTKAAEDTGFVGSLDRATLGLEKKNQVSHFRFYFHETFTANNATSVPVVPALPKYNTTTSFGTVGVMDNALTTGPERSSKLVGRVEGLYAATSQTEFNLLVVLNFVLTEGKYNGSTITILGRNRISQNLREIPVIGGSGVFRFATGVISEVVDMNEQNEDEVGVNEEHADCSKAFNTSHVFATHDDVPHWAQSVAYEIGFVDMIMRLDTNIDIRGRTSFVLIGMGEDSWSLVRNHLLKELAKWSYQYINLLGGIDRFEKLKRSLLVDGLSMVTMDKWINITGMRYEIASSHLVVANFGLPLGLALVDSEALFSLWIGVNGLLSGGIFFFLGSEELTKRFSEDRLEKNENGQWK
ncbi:Dirigent protein 19 [Glycine soja]|uniref:Dirigent protein n=1 Tax=Glycine soja TaxID=3848 RepID=A0A445L7I8_GLYSO|nr:Dirigent protein 19 [Glycine soja]